jgi:hypothetical protein
LEQHLIVNAIDIIFLKNTIASQKEIAEAAWKEDDKDNAWLGTGNWNLGACLHLIHALINQERSRPNSSTN